MNFFHDNIPQIALFDQCQIFKLQCRSGSLSFMIVFHPLPDFLYYAKYLSVSYSAENGPMHL